MINIPSSPEVRRFAVSHFLLESQFWFPVWLIFLTHKGFDLTTIVLADGVFRFAMVALEYPMGVFGDRLGRKTTYVLIGLLATMTYAGIIFIHGEFMLFSVWILWGVYWALSSGASSAYCYELMEQSSSERRQSFEVFGFMRAISSLAALFSHLLAGFLYKIAPEWPFAISAIFSFIAIGIALTLPEIRTIRSKSSSVSEPKTIKALIIILRRNKVFLACSILMALGLIYYWSPRILMQPLFLELDLSSTLVSLVYFFYSLAGVIAGFIATPARDKFGNRSAVFAGFIICWLGVLLTGLSPGYTALFFIPLMSLGYFVSLTILEVILHNELENQHRAAMLSAVSFLGGVVIMLTRPGLGIIADWQNSQFAFLIWAMLGVIVAVGFVVLIRRLPV